MGRPKRSVRRVQANLRIDTRVHERLVSLAGDAGMPLATYLEHVVSQAHGYTGPYLSMHTLPTSLPLAQLRRKVKALDRHMCPPAPPAGADPTVRVDAPLARALKERARGFGVPYNHYLRAVLHLAAGFPAAGAGDQPELDFTDDEGREPSRRAS